MHIATVVTAGTATTALLIVTACSSTDTGSGAAAPQASAPSASAGQAATTVLEGGWTANLKRSAVLAYIHHRGWSRHTQRVLLEPTMAGPKETEFRIDFVGDRFRMSQVDTDAQWQSGTFTLKDDGRIYLDDEAPVGYLAFRYHVDGDQATFDHPGSGPGTMPEFLPGTPDWAPGAVLWASVPWHRAQSQ